MAGSKLAILVGSEYLTRNGMRASVVRKEQNFMWAVITMPSGEVRKMHYFPDGKYHASAETCWDLIAYYAPNAGPSEQTIKAYEAKVSAQAARIKALEEEIQRLTENHPTL